MSRFKTGVLRTPDALRIGFLPTTDCAPLVYAKEAGIFEQYGLSVELARETTWSIGDKVAQGDLDMAQAPAPLPFLTNLGVDADPFSCISPMVLSLQGSGITISTKLWNESVSSARTLLDYICHNWGRRTVTMGVPSHFSTQAFLLKRWLTAGGIDPRNQVRVITVPPDQMYATLKLGYVDLFCAPEPWNSVAVQAGQGVCLATSPDLAPLHAESVLIVRQSFASGRADELERVVAALLDACSSCEHPQNRARLSDLLTHPQYVNAPRECLAADLIGPFTSGHDQPLDPPRHLFHRYTANQPREERATWIIENLYDALNSHAASKLPPERTPILRNIFRRDIWDRARVLSKREATSPAGDTLALTPSALR